MTQRGMSDWGRQLACFAVGDFEKGRYLLLKSSSEKTATVPPPRSDNENTCSQDQKNSGPKTVIYYNIALSTFKIYITL